ncbi:MAG: ribonuclease HI family protein [Nitrospiria bacterium]
MSKMFSVYTDGASRGNPGRASIGVMIQDKDGQALQTLSEYLGIATNNEAEYTALIRGLEAVARFNPDRIDFYLDSQLVVRQMTGEYKIKNKNMQVLAKKVKTLCDNIRPATVHFHHIPREKNKEADRLANEALDAR